MAKPVGARAAITEIPGGGLRQHAGPVVHALQGVSENLRLHGVRGLRVVGASTMPTIVSGSTYAMRPPS